jgi:hypothetical protein
MTSRSKDFNFAEENRDEAHPHMKRGRTTFWTATELSTDEEEEETRLKHLKARNKKKVILPPVLTKRQQSMIDNGLQDASESEAQRLKDEKRLESYIYDGDDFDHARLSDDFYASGSKMYMIIQQVKTEAKALIGSKRSVYSGSTAQQLYNVALSKFNELDRRERLMHPLLQKSELEGAHLTATEWDDLRYEMCWIIGVRESYYNWDWKKDGTKR